jgi:hypothetical protein
MLSTICKRWHRRRYSALARKLEVQELRCALLTKAERDYQNSYYTEKLHDALCVRVEMLSELKYHETVIKRLEAAS